MYLDFSLTVHSEVLLYLNGIIIFVIHMYCPLAYIIFWVTHFNELAI